VPGETTVAPDIVLPRPATLTGVAIGPGGQKVAGVVVHIAGESVGANRKVTTDRNGRFAFDRLAPGRYSLFATPAQPSLDDVQSMGRAMMQNVFGDKSENWIELGPGDTREFNVGVNR
jgi:hypothetical protein